MLSHPLLRLHSRGPSLIRWASAGPGASLQKAFQNSAKAQGRRSAASMQAINGRTDDAAASSAPSQSTDIPASLDITPTAGPLEPSLELKLEAAAPQQARPYPNNVPHLTSDFAPKICVIGVGGAGGNAVNNMIVRGLGGVEYLVCNTDAQALASTLTENRLQLGRDITRGLGCGANPDIGRVAGEESRAELLERVGNANMVFVSAGMGGGTGTGAAPIIAQTCLEAGLLTVGVVTKPFRFEGAHRMRLAEEGLRRMQTSVDTLIVIPNQNLFKMVDTSTTLLDAFRLADDVMLAGVKSVTDLMTMPGLINLDFADVQAVMAGMGNAIMGTGQASGEDRAARAAEDALKNPLLGEISVKTAKGMLVNITGGADMTLHEVDIAAQKVTEEVEDQAANIIFGSAYDHNLEGTVRVSVVATGIEEIDHVGKGGHVYMKQK